MATPHAYFGPIVALGLGAFSVTGSAGDVSAANPATDNAEALKLIYEAAERICPPPPMGGASQVIEVTGAAKAELPGLLKKLADIGIGATGTVRSTQYEGVLQADLGKVIITNTNCRRDVFLSLSTVLLAPRPAAAASDESRARGRAAVKSPRQYHWQCQIEVFDGSTGDTLGRGRLEFGPVTYGTNISYGRASFDALKTTRLSQQITFATSAWSFFGECKGSACMSFIDQSPPHDPVFVVQNVIFDDERGEMDLRGGVMVRTQGQHQWFAYLSGTCEPR
jgi:hypothetical protein